MQIDKELSQGVPASDTVMTVGVFDGVHVGHRHLLAHLRSEADKHGWQSGIVTFKNHPEDTISTDGRLLWLDGLDTRIKLIQSLGIDIAIALSFTPELRQLSPREFAQKLQKHLKMRALIIGPDFAMGKNRQGNYDQLRSVGQELNFSVEVVPPFEVDGEVVSSSLIREVLSRGDMEKVARLLGRAYSLDGKIVSGDRWGRTMGFPTANLEVGAMQAIPKDGVYATITRTEGKVLPSVTNIGFRPTFGGKTRTIETYIIDYQNDLLDKDFSVDFVQRLRDEKHFDSIEELRQQISRDIKQAKPILGQLIL
jgi:riboflavin kinase/FMN adenylyltransferase